MGDSTADVAGGFVTGVVAVAAGFGAVTAVLTFGTMAVVVVLVVGAVAAVLVVVVFGAWMVFDVKDVIGFVAANFLRAASSVVLRYVAMVAILQWKKGLRERSQDHHKSK